MNYLETAGLLVILWLLTFSVLVHVAMVVSVALYWYEAYKDGRASQIEILKKVRLYKKNDKDA